MRYSLPALARQMVFLWLSLGSVWALDGVDSSFAPVIRSAGSVRRMAWHPPSSRLYVSVSGDKYNGQEIHTSLPRFDASGNLDSAYAPVINGTVSQIVIQTDGKILIAGSFTSVDGHATQNLARLLSDGAVDTSFAVATGETPSEITALIAATDGSVYLGTKGSSSTQYIDGQWVDVWPKLLWKYNAAGGMDTSFNPRFSVGSGSPDIAINALLPLPAGSLLACGTFTHINATAQSYLAKLSSTGAEDAAYRPAFTRSSSGAPPAVTSLADAGGGKAYVGGVFSTVNAVSRNSLVRLSATGTTDSAFNAVVAGRFTSDTPIIENIAVDTIGRVMFSGTFAKVNGTSKNGLARVNANAVLTDGMVMPLSSTPPILKGGLAVAAADDLLVAYTGILSVNSVLQLPVTKFLSTTGIIDTTFLFDLRNPRYPDLLSARPGTGPILSSFWMKDVNGIETGSLAALNSVGQVDTGFQPVIDPSGGVKASLVLPDGRVLVGGRFFTVGGLPRRNLALLEANGDPVTDFDLGTGPDTTVDLLRLLPTGKILVTGSFTNINGEDIKNLALLDLTAIPATHGLVVEQILEARYGTDSSYLNVLPKVSAALIGGAVNITVNSTTMGGDPSPGSTKYLTVRFRTNRGERTARIADSLILKLPNVAWDSGLMDRTFRPTNTESLTLNDAGGQTDGKIILIGYFSTFAGNSIPYMVRLFPDGSVDTGFKPAPQFSSFPPRAMQIMPSGQIYISGTPLRLSGSSNSIGICRLAPSGGVDPSFTCPAFVGLVDDFEVLPDGGALCCGSFNGTAAGERIRLVRLTTSGAVAPDFDAGTSANDTVYGLAFESPGKMWIRGPFSSVQGIPRRGLAQINLNSGIAPLAQVTPVSTTVTAGTTATFGLAGCGSGETYSWFRNGVPIQGANGPLLALSCDIPVAPQTYTAQVVNSAGTTISSGTLTVREALLAEWLAMHGLNGLQADEDTDGDGVNNTSEYLAHTSPIDGHSVFATRMERLSGGFRFRWDSFPGRQYRIDQSSDLTAWVPFGAPISGDGGEKFLDVPYSESVPQRYWRLSVSKP